MQTQSLTSPLPSPEAQSALECSQEETGDAEREGGREGRGGGSRGLGKPLEQSLLPHVGASSQGMKMRPRPEPPGNTAQTPLWRLKGARQGVQGNTEVWSGGHQIWQQIPDTGETKRTREGEQIS